MKKNLCAWFVVPLVILVGIFLCYLPHVTALVETEHAITHRSNHTYTSWGGEAMGIANYTDYLLNYIGAENLNEVIIAVLDTGIDTDHPWFENRIVNDYAKGFYDGYFMGIYVGGIETSDYEDVNGHGTHVAGIICDLTLPNVKILPIKVLPDSGTGIITSMIRGINYVTELKNNGLNIVALNFSIGSNVDIQGVAQSTYANAFQAAYDSGILPIVAAGNDGADVANDNPANVDCVVTVASIGCSDNNYFHATKSNWGEFIDVCAPGDRITSARVGGGTITYSGTSMAAPHVAAAVGLLQSDPTKHYSLQDIEDILDQNTIDLGDEGWDKYYGEGLVNLGNIYVDTNYHVNHYYETLNEEGNVINNGKHYALGSCETLHGYCNTLTSAILQNRLGFISQPFEQLVINRDGDTVINIFYNRQIYHLELNTTSGVKQVIGNGFYQYGASVTIDAILEDAYDWIGWDSDIAGIFPNNIEKQYIFNMPANDLLLTPKISLKTYLITVKVYGPGSVSQSTQIVTYDTSLNFLFVADENSYLKQLILDGITIEPVQEYQLENIRALHEIEVYFEEQKILDYTNDQAEQSEGEITDNVLHENDTNDFSYLALIASVTLITITSIILLVMVFKLVKQ